MLHWEHWRLYAFSFVFLVLWKTNTFSPMKHCFPIGLSELSHSKLARCSLCYWTQRKLELWNIQVLFCSLIQALDQTCKYCSEQGILFPRVDLSEEDRRNLKECYLFDGAETPGAPVLLFFPLINDTFQKYKAPGKSSKLLRKDRHHGQSIKGSIFNTPTLDLHCRLISVHQTSLLLKVTFFYHIWFDAVPVLFQHRG